MPATPVRPGPVYPVGLRLAGRRVVVVGGGQVAHRRVAGLLDAHAVVTVVSPEVTPALEALVEPGAVTWLPRAYAPGDLAEAWYAVAATGSTAVDAAVAEEAETRRIFCARSDDSEPSVWTPAVGRQGDLVVGVHGGRPGARRRRPGRGAGRADRRFPRRRSRPGPPAAAAAWCWSAAGPATPG